MRILAFDTATSATTVALSAVGEEVLEARDDPPAGSRPGHATHLLPLAAELLQRAQIDWPEIELIAVGTGPGTFTGLRIGVATARALATAGGTPIAPVSTLYSLAWGARAWPERARIDTVVAVLDARRGEVFAAGWNLDELDAAHSALIAPAALAPDALSEVVGGMHRSTLAIGDGAVEFRQALERSGAFVPEDGSELHRVSAVNHCRIAAQLQAEDPDQIRPVYLRLPDAEIARRAAAKQ